MQNKELIFKNEELKIDVRTIKNEDGSISINIEDTAKGFGFIRIKNEKEYIMWDRINKYLSEFGFPHKCGKGDYIPETIFYLLGMKANNETAKTFQMWICSEVLPEIRKNGMYISEDATTEQKEYNYNMLDVTFTNCSVELLSAKYEECMKFHNDNKTRIPYGKNSKKRADATHSHSESKIMIMERVSKILTNRALTLEEERKFGLTDEIYKVKERISLDIMKQNNMSNGRKLGARTKKINRLEQQLPPKIEEYSCINVHGFTVNCMYDSVGDKKVKSDAYKTWIRKFPMEQLDGWDNIDWDKKVKLYLVFNCLDKFDTDNLIKSFQDRLVEFYGVDDNKIVLGSVDKNVVNSYEEGKIYFYLENV